MAAYIVAYCEAVCKFLVPKLIYADTAAHADRERKSAAMSLLRKATHLPKTTTIPTWNLFLWTVCLCFCPSSSLWATARRTKVAQVWSQFYFCDPVRPGGPAEAWH